MTLTKLKEQAVKNYEAGSRRGYSNGIIDGVAMEVMAKKIGVNKPGRKEYFKFTTYKQVIFNDQ